MRGKRNGQRRGGVSRPASKPAVIKTDSSVTACNSFDDMGLSPDLLKGIYGFGFKNPSEIQSLAIKQIVDGKSVIAFSQSGTGKTGAFVIGFLSRIDPSEKSTQVIVMSHTRELAQQIRLVVSELSKFLGITHEYFSGGTSEQEDEQKAKECPHVVVCTPGRCAHLLKSKCLTLEKLRVFCIDEADHVLSSDSFHDQIQEIFKYIDPARLPQFLFFSATFSESSYELIQGLVKDAVCISVKEEKYTLDGIRQFFINVHSDKKKIATLIDLYQSINANKTIIFTSKIETANYLYGRLQDAKFPVGCIHGGMSQADRNEVMKDFRGDKYRYLVSSDLLSRGIDIQQVTLIINFELPVRNEQYIHRIGRSGRYGRKGVAINICSEDDMKKINELKSVYNTEIEELPQNIDEILRKIQLEVDGSQTDQS